MFFFFNLRENFFFVLVIVMNIWKVYIFRNLLILEIITSIKEYQLQLF